jgi:hypothetical protein
MEFSAAEIGNARGDCTVAIAANLAYLGENKIKHTKILGTSKQHLNFAQGF